MRQLTEGEWEQIRVGSHFIQITNEGGEPEITIRDHAQIRVEGEHKDNPTVVIGENEFRTEFMKVSEKEYWSRYNG